MESMRELVLLILTVAAVITHGCASSQRSADGVRQEVHDAPPLVQEPLFPGRDANRANIANPPDRDIHSMNWR